MHVRQRMSCWVLALVLLATSLRTSLASTQQPVLILDIDGTLYDDDCMIESSIRDNCHLFAAKFGYDSAASDVLHHKYGSTIGGIVALGKPREIVSDYYNEVYPNINMDKLRKYNMVPISTSDNTGYNSNLHRLHRRSLSLLSKLDHKIVIASNSPIFHVKRVLSRLGLAHLPVDSIVTPERRNGLTKKESEFWDIIFDLYPKEHYKCTLIDDNHHNIETVRSLGMNGIHISPKYSFTDAITEFVGLGNNDFIFDEVKYLTSKNSIDMKAISTVVHKKLKDKLSTLYKKESKQNRVVIDVGAGLLSMLPQVIKMYQEIASSKVTLHYLAFETNSKLANQTSAFLQELGFVQGEHSTYTLKRSSLSVQVSILPYDFMSPDTPERVDEVLHQQGVSTPRKIDCIIGCCVADLIEPNAFCAQLIELANDGGALVYLPITFNGETAMDTYIDQENNGFLDHLIFNTYHRHLANNGHHTTVNKLIDTFTGHGAQLLELRDSNWVIQREKDSYMWHSLTRFLATGAGLDLLHTGNKQQKQDTIQWFKDLQSIKKNSFVIGNKDILFEIPKVAQVILAGPKDAHAAEDAVYFGYAAKDEFFHYPKFNESSATITMADIARKMQRSDAASSQYPTTRKAVLFTNPRQIAVIEEEIPELKSEQVLVKTLCTLISTGTEVKVFNGARDYDQMGDDYPIRYGYSHVGTVLAVGDDNNQNLIGKRVFTFSPHNTYTVADAASIVLVPDDISPLDAVFLPSVETAVSLVMDTQPVLGEQVAVIGAGLIGLLATSVLKYGLNSDVTAIDISDIRLQNAQHFFSLDGCIRTYNPTRGSPKENKFDKIIECSGSFNGLQTAINAVKKGGSITIGSWYGEQKGSLQLGMQNFHRNEVTLITSQVSSIRTSLGSRWTKDRRFQLCWDMIRKIQPGKRLLTPKSILSYQDAAAIQAAYESLSEQSKNGQNQLTMLLVGENILE